VRTAFGFLEDLAVFLISNLVGAFADEDLVDMGAGVSILAALT
jgi:hypothetical protein